MTDNKITYGAKLYLICPSHIPNRPSQAIIYDGRQDKHRTLDNGFGTRVKITSTKKFSSVIWNYFEIINDECAKCKICDGKYSRKGKGTTF